LLTEKDTEANGSGARFFELFDLPEADLSGELVAFVEDCFGVRGSGFESARENVGGDGLEVGDRLGRHPFQDIALWSLKTDRDGFSVNQWLADISREISRITLTRRRHRVSDRDFRALKNRGLRGTRLASVGGCEEVDARGAVFGIALELVLEVRRETLLGVSFEQLDSSAAVHAAKLGVVVFQSDGDGLDLPEGLVTASGTNATALHFTLVEFFPFGCHKHLDGHESAGGTVGWDFSL